MNIAVRGKPLSHDCHVSSISKGILNVLASLNDSLSDTPPIDQPQRFGNKAFKIWYEKLKNVSIFLFIRFFKFFFRYLQFYVYRTLKIYSNPTYQKNITKRLSKSRIISSKASEMQPVLITVPGMRCPFACFYVVYFK